MGVATICILIPHLATFNFKERELSYPVKKQLNFLRKQRHYIERIIEVNSGSEKMHRPSRKHTHDLLRNQSLTESFLFNS